MVPTSVKPPSSKWPSRPIGTKQPTCCVTMFCSFLFLFLIALISLRSTIRESSKVQVPSSSFFYQCDHGFIRSGDVLNHINHIQGGTGMPSQPLSLFLAVSYAYLSFRR